MCLKWKPKPLFQVLLDLRLEPDGFVSWFLCDTPHTVDATDVAGYLILWSYALKGLISSKYFLFLMCVSRPSQECVQVGGSNLFVLYIEAWTLQNYKIWVPGLDNLESRPSQGYESSAPRSVFGGSEGAQKETYPPWNYQQKVGKKIGIFAPIPGKDPTSNPPLSGAKNVRFRFRVGPSSQAIPSYFLNRKPTCREVQSLGKFQQNSRWVEGWWFQRRALTQVALGGKSWVCCCCWFGSNRLILRCKRQGSCLDFEKN